MFHKHTVKGKGGLAGLGDVADTWVFPPMVSIQKHFNMGKFKPYVGVGVSYMKFFNEKLPASSALRGSNYTDVDVSDAWGINAQIGVDVSLGDGWVASAEVRKSWIDADVKWTGDGVAPINGDLDLNPIVVSVGFGRRFDLF